ncbi:helix-turn-helix domain-containing protein [Nocardia wallacei]|uniref:helix-turn-helix domain-containing protein n=1 Tax=Nocardia wallacei TaxID=480035 RepID=UPI001656D366|nr:helix-turn-helix domain-containing protein [Nocardia wallacei]
MGDVISLNPVVQVREAFESLPDLVRRPIEMVVFGGDLPRADISRMRELAAELRARAAALQEHAHDAGNLLAQQDSIGAFADELREMLHIHQDGAGKLGQQALTLADQADGAANDAEKTLCVMFVFGIELGWRIIRMLAAASAAGPAGQAAAAPAVEATLVQGRAEVQLMRAGLKDAYGRLGANTAAKLSALGPASFAMTAGRAAVLPVAVDGGVQLLQVAEGYRNMSPIGENRENPTGFDTTSVLVAGAAGAAGAAGGQLAAKFAPKVLPRMETSRTLAGLVHGTAGAAAGLTAAAMITGWPEDFDHVLAPMLNGAFAGSVHAQPGAHARSGFGAEPVIDGSEMFTRPDLPPAGPSVKISAESRQAWETARKAWNTGPDKVIAGGASAPPRSPANNGTALGASHGTPRVAAGAETAAPPRVGATSTHTPAAPEHRPADGESAPTGRRTQHANRPSGEERGFAAADGPPANHRPGDENTSTTTERGTPADHRAAENTSTTTDAAPANHRTDDNTSATTEDGTPANHRADDNTSPTAEDGTGSYRSGEESPGSIAEDGTAAGERGGGETHGSTPEDGTGPGSRDQAEEVLADFHARSGEQVPEALKLSNLSDEVLQAGLFHSDARESLIAGMEIIRRGTVDGAPGGMVLRGPQLEGGFEMARRPVQMLPGQGKTLMFMSYSLQQAVRHGSVLLVTTADGLAHREYTEYKRVLSRYGIDVLRADQNTGFGAVTPGRPAIVVATGETVGHLCNAGHTPPRRAVIDEMDAIVDRGERTFIRSEMSAAEAPEPTVREVLAAHDFLADALATGRLSHEDFGLKQIAEEVDVHLPDGTFEVGTEYWYDGQAALTPAGRAKVAALPDGKRWLEGMGPSRLDMAAAAEFTTRNKTHYVIDRGKIVIVDQGEHGLQRNPKTSSESRWSAEPGKASLAQAVEAKEIRAAEAIGMSAEQHGIVVRADTDSAKSITAAEIYGTDKYFDHITGASGTLTDLGHVLKTVYGLETPHAVDPYNPSRLVEGQPDVHENTRAKLNALAGYAHQMWDGGQGRFQEILCHRNDLVDKQVNALLRAGIPRDAIEAVDADRIAKWGADWETKLQQVFDAAGEQGKILVINRQGQRGVDISVSDAVLAKGGMHVWMTEVPEQSYIYDQAKNRTARNGKPGTAQALMSPQDELIRKAMHLRGVREAVVTYQDAVTAHRADPTPATHDKLVEAGDHLGSLVPGLQERAHHHATNDFIWRYAALVNPGAVTGPTTLWAPTDPTESDEPAGRSARLAALLGVPTSTATTLMTALDRDDAADQDDPFDPDDGLGNGEMVGRHRTPGRDETVGTNEPVGRDDALDRNDARDLGDATDRNRARTDPLGGDHTRGHDSTGPLDPANLPPAVVETLRQHLDATAPGKAVQYALFTDEQALAHLTPRRDRLAATMGLDPADFDGAEGMRRAGAALTAAKHDLALALGVPVSDVTAATARDVLGEALSRPGTDDVVAPASLYLATAALLDLVAEIHRRSANNCVRNGVTAMRVLCPQNADRFTMPSGKPPLRGHDWDIVTSSFRDGSQRLFGSLDQAVESLKGRPGGVQVLVYKWKHTEKKGSAHADNHLVLLVNDSKPGDPPNLVVVDLAASRDGRTDDDFGPEDLADRRTLLNKAVAFDKWRREQQKFINRLPEGQRAFWTIDFDAAGDLVPAAPTRAATDVPDEMIREINAAGAAVRVPVPSGTGSRPGSDDSGSEKPSTRDERGSTPKALRDALGFLERVDCDPAVLRDAREFVFACYREYRGRGESAATAANNTRRLMVNIRRRATKDKAGFPERLADLYRGEATAATWKRVWVATRPSTRGARTDHPPSVPGDGGSVGSRPHDEFDGDRHRTTAGPAEPDPIHATRDALSDWAARLSDEELRASLADVRARTSAHVAAVRRGEPPVAEVAIGAARVQTALAAEQWRRIADGGSGSVTAVSEAAGGVFDLIGALSGAGTRSVPEDDLDVLNRFPERVAAAAELDAMWIVDGANWARLADDHLVSGRDGDWDPELMRSLRSLPSRAAEFAAASAASDRAFGAAARRYIPDAYRAARYFLTCTRDTEQATALLRDVDRAVATAVDRLGPDAPAITAGLSLFQLRMDIHQSIAAAGGAAGSAMRSAARQGLAENALPAQLMRRVSEGLDGLARHGDETPRQLRPSYTAHRIAPDELLDDEDDRPPAARSRAIGVHGGSLVEPNGPSLEPLRTGPRDVSFLMDPWGRMMVGDDHESLLRLMAAMGDELAGWGTLATDDDGHPDGQVRPYRVDEIFDPMGTTQLRDALTRGGLHLDDNNFDNESQGRLWRGDPTPVPAVFDMAPVGFQDSIEAMFSGYAEQFWVKPVRDGIRLSPNQLRVPLTLAPLRREPGHIEVVAYKDGDRTIVGYRDPDPGAEPTQVATVFAALHQRMTRWVAESDNVEWHPDTAATVDAFTRHLDRSQPDRFDGTVGSRPSDALPDPAEVKPFGNWLRAARKALGISRGELATRMGVPGSATYIGSFERGITPTRDMMVRILAALGISDELAEAVLREATGHEIDNLPDPREPKFLSPNAWIQAARLRRKMPQRELAAHVGLSVTQWAPRERAENPRTRAHQITREQAQRALDALQATETVTAAFMARFYPSATPDSAAPDSGNPSGSVGSRPSDDESSLPTGDGSRMPFRILADPGMSGDREVEPGYWGHYGAAGVLVRCVDPDGVERFLICKTKDRFSQDNWQFPGGALASRETPAEGAARVMNEKLGADAEYLARLVHRGTHVIGGPRGWKYHVLVADAPRRFDPNVRGTKGSAARWVTRDELAELAERGEVHSALTRHLPHVLAVFAPETEQPPAPPVADSTVSPAARPEGFRPEPAFRRLDQAMFDDYVRLDELRRAARGQPSHTAELTRRKDEFFARYPQAREPAVYGQLLQYGTLRENSNQLAADLGLRPDELRARLAAELTDLVAGKPLAIRVRREALFGLLADGRFKTQFEGALGGGRRDEVARLENRWFGNPEDMDPRLRPVYGLVLVDGERPAGLSDAATPAEPSDIRATLYTEKAATYGRIEVVLKDDVRQRATFCVGDSLVYSGSQAGGKRARTIPSPLLDPQPESFGIVPLSAKAVTVDDQPLRGTDRDYSGNLFRRHQFVESHIHGGVTLADIDHINLPEPPDAELRAALDNAGIPWRVLDSHAIARSGDPEAVARERLRLEQDLAVVETRAYYLRRELDAARRPDTPRKVLEESANIRVQLRNVEAMRDRILEMLAPLAGPSGSIGSRPSDGPDGSAMFDGLALTAAETEIVTQARNGATYHDIATALHIPERDVRATLAGVRRKLRNQRAQLVTAGRPGDLPTASESDRLRDAMVAALIDADQPDPRQLIAEASPEQLKRVVHGPVSDAGRALRPAGGRARNQVFRNLTLLAARRSIHTLAAEHNRAQAVLTTALAAASPDDLRAALDELDPTQRQILLNRFGPAAPPAAFEPEGSVRDSRAFDLVRQVAASIAARTGTSAVDENNELLTAVHRTNIAAAQTYTANECLDAVLEWMDRRDRSQADVPPAPHRPSLPVDHGFDDEQRRTADAALRAGGFRNADELQRWANHLQAEFSQRRATENGDWWDSLRDPDQPGRLSSAQRALIQVYPHQIGNADGLPAVIRDHANRLSIRRDLDEFLARRPAGTGMLEWARNGLTAAERNRLSNLIHIRNHLQELDSQAAGMPGSPPVHLLSYDSTAFRGKGKAVAALGNVDTAHTVNWHVPGTDTTSSSLAYQFKSARNLYTESRKVDPSLELASIIWIGYEAPTGPVKTGFVKAAFRRRARIGGDRLVCDVAAFHATRRRAGTATPDKLVNRLYGHSYGSVTTCYAGRGGRLAGLIGSVILSGSPGAGPLDHAEDFGIGAHNVYVLASWRDPVTMFGADEPGAGSRYHRGLGLGIDPATEAFGGQRLGAEFPDSPDFAGVEAVHQGYLHYDPVTGQPNEALFHSAHITAGRGDTLTRVPPRRAGRVAFRPIDAERDRYADLGGDSAPGTGNTGGSADPGGLIGSRPHDEELLPNERSALAHRLTERRAELLRELSALLAPHGIDPAELLRTGSPTWAAWFTRYQEVRRDLVAGLEIDRGAAVDDRWIRHVLAEWREQGVATPEILSAGREFDRILPVAALVDDIQRLDDWARTVEALEAELTRRTVELSVLLGRVQGMLGTIADFRPAGVLVAILDSALATADRLAAARQRLEQHAHDLHSSGTAVAERERTTFTPSDEEILSAARPYRLSSLDSWHGMALLHARLQYLVAAAEDPGNELSVPDDIAELHRLAARSQAAVARYETTQLLDTGLDVTLDLVKRMLAGLPTAAGGTAWQLSEFSDSAPFEQRLTAVRDDVAKRWRHQVATAHLGRETSRARTRLSRIDTVTAALDEAGHRITLGRKMLIRQMSEHLRKYPLDRRMDRGQLEPDLMTILNAVRVCEAALPGDGWAESTPAQLRRRVDRLRGDAETAQVADQAERYLSLRLLVAAFEDATPWIHWLYELVGHSRSLERLTDRPAAETGSTRDPTAESGRFDADLDEWLDAALVTVGRAGGLAVMPEGSVGSRPSAYDIAGATAGLTERPAPEDPGLVLDFDPADRDRADAAVAALAELLRARGWRNTVHAAAAPELARRAIADARDYLDAYRAELPRHLGSIPEDRRARALQDLDIRLTARLSTAADGSRSLHLSVECPQYRPPYRPYEPHGAAWPAPLHSARHVGPAVRELLSSATRAGIEQWGEVWADFTEPPTGAPATVPAPPATPFEAKARMVRALYEDHHVRFVGWEPDDVPPQALESLIRHARARFAEDGRLHLREIRIADLDEDTGAKLGRAAGQIRSRGSGDPFGHNHYVTLTINRNRVIDLERHRQQTRFDVAKHHLAPMADALGGVFDHEWRHVVDSFTGYRLSRVAEPLLTFVYSHYLRHGLLPPALTFEQWRNQLPRYALNEHEDGGYSWNDSEGFAEGSRAATADPSLPPTHPARVLDWLAHRYLDGTRPDHVLADWLADHPAVTPDFPEAPHRDAVQLFRNYYMARDEGVHARADVWWNRILQGIPTPEGRAYVQRRLDNELMLFATAASPGVRTRAELDRELTAAVRRAFSGEIVAHVTADTLWRVLADGRFPNGMEHTQRPGGPHLSPADLARLEYVLFGHPTYLAPEYRPAYCEIRSGPDYSVPRSDTSSDSADIRVVLGEHVADRTTACVGDVRQAPVFPSRLDDPRPESFAPAQHLVQAQVHGGFTLIDVDHLVFLRRAPDRALRKALAQAGIPWRTAEGIRPARHGDGLPPARRSLPAPEYARTRARFDAVAEQDAVLRTLGPRENTPTTARPNSIGDTGPAGLIGSRPSTEDVVTAVALLPPRPDAADPDLVLDFRPGDEEQLAAAANALADLLRAHDWRAPAHLAVAADLVRRAGREALAFLDRSFRTLRRELGVPDHLDINPQHAARLTVRLSTAPDGARTLHLSVECAQHRPVYEPYADTTPWPAPLHNDREVGAEVRAALSAATRSGVEPWGEVWADFTEPPAESRPPELPPPATPREAKARIVRALYEDLHLRLGGWEDPEIPPEAVAALADRACVLIAEFGRRRLREIRIEPYRANGVTFSEGSVDPAGFNHHTTIVMDKQYLLQVLIIDDLPALRARAEHHEAINFWGRSDDPLGGVLDHEFRHALDAASGYRLSALSEQLLPLIHTDLVDRGLLPRDVTFQSWFDQLPGYGRNVEPVDGVSRRAVENFAEGGRTGSSDPSLPSTHPARALDWLTRRYLDGTVPDSAQEVFRDWLADHQDLAPDTTGTHPSPPSVPENPLAHPVPTVMRPDHPTLSRQIRTVREAAGRALETLGDTGDPARREVLREALDQFEAAARELDRERGLRAAAADEYDRAVAADSLDEEVVTRRDHHTARVARHENRMLSAVAELAVIVGAPALSAHAQVENDPADNDSSAGRPDGGPDTDGPTGSIGSRPGEEDPSPTEFRPGMSAAEIRGAVADALRDTGDTPAGAPLQLTNSAALLVDYALRAAGGDGVRLWWNTTPTAAGHAVRGHVEGLRVPRPRGVLADSWGGEVFGEFEWADPGDGSGPSWSVRLWGDRKRFQRFSAELPAQLASLMPSYAASQALSPIAEAVRVVSSRKGVGRGGTLAVEARDGRLRVRVREGVVPLIGVPDRFARTIGESEPPGRIGSRPHENDAHDGPFDSHRPEGRIGSRPGDEEPVLVSTQRLQGRPGVRMDLLTYEYPIRQEQFQIVRETYDRTSDAVVTWTEALIGRALGAPIKDVRVEPPQYHVLYRNYGPPPSQRDDPRAADALGIFDAITGERSRFADIFIRRAGGRAMWRDHHLRGQDIVDMAEGLHRLGVMLWQRSFPESILSIMLHTIDSALVQLSEIAEHADHPVLMAGLDEETQAKARLVETFKLKHPYIEVTGFDTPYASKQAVEEILGKLDELFDKYRYTPGYRKLRTNIRAVRIEVLGRPRAIADPRYDEATDTIDGSELVFNLRYAIDPNATSAQSNQNATDNWHPASGKPYEDDALHEFAHAIDEATGDELSRNLSAVLRETYTKLTRLGLYDSYEDWLGQLPGHAYASPTMSHRAAMEALAVGFADAEINGTVVGSPQWVIYEYVTNLEPPRIHWSLRLGDPAHPGTTGSIGSRPSEDSPGGPVARRMTGLGGRDDDQAGPPAGPGERFAKLIDDGLADGVTHTEPLPGPPGVRLELVTFDNGYQAVRETYGDIDSAAREWLHSMMGAAMGAPVAETCLRSDDYQVLYRELVPGRPASTVLPQSTARAYDHGLVHEDLSEQQRELAARFGPLDTRHLASAAADLLGLFDAATGTRRSTRHWNIDANDAVWGGRGAVAAEDTGPSPFAARFVRHVDGATVWRDHHLSRADITDLRERVSYVGELIEQWHAELPRAQRDTLHATHARVLAALARAEQHAVHTPEEISHVSGLSADAQTKTRLVENFTLDHPYFEIAGFDHPLLPVDAAREILETLDRLLSRFRYTPGFRGLMTNIRGLRIDFMNHLDINAETIPETIADGRGRTRWMTFNLRRAADRTQARKDDREDREEGFHPASGRPYHDDVVHEFAHAIDHALGGRLSENLETVLHEAWEALQRNNMIAETYPEWLRRLPGAAFTHRAAKKKLDPSEALAVGFIDVEINGAVPGTPQWVIHHYVTTAQPPRIGQAGDTADGPNEPATPWSRRRTDSRSRSNGEEGNPRTEGPKATPWSTVASAEETNVSGRRGVPHPHGYDLAQDWLRAARDGLSRLPEQMDATIGLPAGTWSAVERGERQLTIEEMRILMRREPSIRRLYAPLAQHFFPALASVPGPEVGAGLRYFREQAGLTPGMFAHRLGVLEVTVSHRESASRLPPVTAAWQSHVRALAAGTGHIDETAEIGGCLATLRERVGLPLRHLAEQLGVTPDTLADIEAGRRPPERAEVEAYLRALPPGRPRFPEGYSHTGEYLRFLREDAGVWLQEAARRASMSRAMIINRETGRAKLSPEFVEMYLREYGQGAVTLDEIAELSDRPLVEQPRAGVPPRP